MTWLFPEGNRSTPVLRLSMISPDWLTNRYVDCPVTSTKHGRVAIREEHIPEGFGFTLNHTYPARTFVLCRTTLELNTTFRLEEYVLVKQGDVYLLLDPTKPKVMAYFNNFGPVAEVSDLTWLARRTGVIH